MKIVIIKYAVMTNDAMDKPEMFDSLVEADKRARACDGLLMRYEYELVYHKKVRDYRPLYVEE